MTWIVIALSLVGLVYGGLGLLVGPPNGAWRLIVVVGSAVAFVLGAANLYWGHTLGTLRARIEDRLAEWLEKRLGRDILVE